MDAMTFIATQLDGRREAVCAVRSGYRGTYAEAIRVLLEERGALSARTIEQELGLPTGRCSALVKRDMQIGRIRRYAGMYELVPGWRPRRQVVLEPGQEVLTWHSVDEQLPDSDTTVLLRIEDAESEPVWPGFLDGDQWKLADGMPVEKVLRWADMPAGATA